MRDADTIIGGLCNAVDVMENSAIHNFQELVRAQARDDLALHPDDARNRISMIVSRAEALRQRAHKMDMLAIEIQLNILQYQLMAAE